MSKNQVKYLFYSLTRNSPNPLDSRLSIDSLSTIDTELLLTHRYAGLIFFVKDINKHYLFLNDLTTPITLQSFISNENVKGIASTDYSTLINSLNSLNPIMCEIITVFPLTVSFIFDGTNWSYYNGDYIVANDTILNSLPNQLRKANKLIISTEDGRSIFTSDLNKSKELLEFNSIPTTIENNRYYNINGILYFSIADNLYKLSEKTLLLENHFIDKTENLNVSNIVTHNFNSPYVSGFIWINKSINQLLNTNKLIQLQIDIVNNDTIKIISNIPISGNILLTCKN